MLQNLLHIRMEVMTILGSSLANSDTSLQEADGFGRMALVHDEEELLDSVTDALKKLIAALA